MDITICVGSSCHLKGSRDIISIFERLVEKYNLKDKVELKGSFCMGECTNAGVCVCLGEERFKVIPSEAAEFFEKEVLPRVS